MPYPFAGEFSALLDDLAEVQRRRAAAAPVHRAIERHGIVPGQFAKAMQQAEVSRAATAAELTRTIAGIERVAAETAKLQQQRVGERRARVRAEVQDVLRRAMEGVAKGAITALEVARLEASAMRTLASLDDQAATPVRARVAA